MGRTVPVYYDPRSPGRSVLHPEIGCVGISCLLSTAALLQLGLRIGPQGGLVAGMTLFVAGILGEMVCRWRKEPLPLLLPPQTHGVVEESDGGGGVAYDGDDDNADAARHTMAEEETESQATE